MTIKNNERSKPGSLGKLYDVLDAAFPGHRTRLGFLSVRRLSIDLDMTSQAVYKWFSTDSLPPNQVNPLLELSGGRLKLKDLTPFVFR